MSELFGDAVSRTCASDRDRDIFQLAYSVSLFLSKLGDEYELWDNASLKRTMEKLEKIKRMTNETYDEIARVMEEQEEDDDESGN